MKKRDTNCSFNLRIIYNNSLHYDKVLKKDPYINLKELFAVSSNGSLKKIQTAIETTLNNTEKSELINLFNQFKENSNSMHARISYLHDDVLDSSGNYMIDIESGSITYIQKQSYASHCKRISEIIHKIYELVEKRLNLLNAIDAKLFNLNDEIEKATKTLNQFEENFKYYYHGLKSNINDIEKPKFLQYDESQINSFIEALNQIKLKLDLNKINWATEDKHKNWNSELEFLEKILIELKQKRKSLTNNYNKQTELKEAYEHDDQNKIRQLIFEAGYNDNKVEKHFNSDEFKVVFVFKWGSQNPPINPNKLKEIKGMFQESLIVEELKSIMSDGLYPTDDVLETELFNINRGFKIFNIGITRSDSLTIRTNQTIIDSLKYSPYLFTFDITNYCLIRSSKDMAMFQIITPRFIPANKLTLWILDPSSPYSDKVERNRAITVMKMLDKARIPYQIFIP